MDSCVPNLTWSSIRPKTFPHLLHPSIFDDDNSQSVDYKEMMIGLETFKESSMDEKLKGMLAFWCVSESFRFSALLFHPLISTTRSNDIKIHFLVRLCEVFIELCDDDGNGKISQ